MNHDTSMPAAHVQRPLFILQPWPPGASGAGDTTGVARFVSDWRRGCLPLPVCSATSRHVFDAYRFWCELQGIAAPTGHNRLVGAAVAQGFVAGRHKVSVALGKPAMQFAMVHPPGQGPAVAGAALDDAATAFRMALQAWRSAVAPECNPSGATQ